MLSNYVATDNIWKAFGDSRIQEKALSIYLPFLTDLGTVLNTNSIFLRTTISGYVFKSYELKINRLLFMDDIKLHGNA